MSEARKAAAAASSSSSAAAAAFCSVAGCLATGGTHATLATAVNDSSVPRSVVVAQAAVVVAVAVVVLHAKERQTNRSET